MNFIFALSDVRHQIQIQCNLHGKYQHQLSSHKVRGEVGGGAAESVEENVRCLLPSPISITLRSSVSLGSMKFPLHLL